MIRSAGVTGPKAVIAFGLGLSLIPKFAPSAIDGFLVGAVLSGACCLLFVVPRRILGRSRLPARDDLLPAPTIDPAVPDLYIAAPGLAPFGDQSNERLVDSDVVFFDPGPLLADCRPVGSRHGLDQRVPITWRSLLGPSSPRHAAPSPLIGALAVVTLMAAKFTVRPLPVRN